MRIVILLFALLGFTLVSCRFGMGKRIHGNGNMTTDTRNPGDFRKVEQKGSFDIILKTGPAHEVVIEAEENIAPHIETQIDNNTLVIRTQEGFRLDPKRDIKIVVTSPEFEEVWSNGSGNITSETLLADSNSLTIGTRGSGDITLQVQVPEVIAKSFGSGNIKLTGETRTVSLETAGSGDLTAEDLKAETVTIDINGSGNATVNASKSLEVSVKGSGDVGYKGNPALKTDIKGSGNLHKLD
ncbi:head GIN domain-containing protein [Flavihumibacter profundi]|uniref:head GIN domain-containing protein n=1 Tax=Flavihumibacter profundi TaxID=2716883 RepID=UPI001CC69EB3|nr:head GIN domain-containing protein [Flavihumibacter profundi]MBZ5859189.1 DUF2807 domain-containing protein [Flavihumibacter profundi]